MFCSAFPTFRNPLASPIPPCNSSDCALPVLLQYHSKQRRTHGLQARASSFKEAPYTASYSCVCRLIAVAGIETRTSFTVSTSVRFATRTTYYERKRPLHALTVLHHILDLHGLQTLNKASLQRCAQ